MKRLLVVTGLMIGASASGAAADCTCRYRGGDIPEGQTTCFQTAQGPTLARCEKVLNNTSWKLLDQPCPTASLRPDDAAGRLFSPRAISLL
ncbi:MAG: hypothetical protein VYD64_01185 [Pseudomonadota bacterium]|nr:hypothetical protein [Pseudomonadota bacterium]